VITSEQEIKIQELEDTLLSCKTTAKLQIQLGQDKIQELENRISHKKIQDIARDTMIVDLEKELSLCKSANELQEVKIKDIQTKLSCCKSTSYSKIQEHQNKIQELQQEVSSLEIACNLWKTKIRDLEKDGSLSKSTNESQEVKIKEYQTTIQEIEINLSNFQKISELQKIQIDDSTKDKTLLNERLQENEFKLTEIKKEYDKKIHYNEQMYELKLMEQINIMTYKLEQVQNKFASKKNVKGSKCKLESELNEKYDKELKTLKESYNNEIIDYKVKIHQLELNKQNLELNNNNIMTQLEKDKELYEGKLIRLELEYDSKLNTIYTPLISELCDGFVYCLSNNQLNVGIYKIGVTAKQTPVERLKQLNSATGLVYPHKLEFSKKVINCKEKEIQLHTILSKIGKRVNPKREFFECELSIIKYVFELIDGEWVY
jgi:hypothetical protein